MEIHFYFMVRAVPILCFPYAVISLEYQPIVPIQIETRFPFLQSKQSQIPWKSEWCFDQNHFQAIVSNGILTDGSQYEQLQTHTNWFGLSVTSLYSTQDPMWYGPLMWTSVNRVTSKSE